MDVNGLLHSSLKPLYPKCGLYRTGWSDPSPLDVETTNDSHDERMGQRLSGNFLPKPICSKQHIYPSDGDRVVIHLSWLSVAVSLLNQRSPAGPEPGTLWSPLGHQVTGLVLLCSCESFYRPWLVSCFSHLWKKLSTPDSQQHHTFIYHRTNWRSGTIVVELAL